MKQKMHWVHMTVKFELHDLLFQSTNFQIQDVPEKMNPFSKLNGFLDSRYFFSETPCMTTFDLLFQS